MMISLHLWATPRLCHNISLHPSYQPRVPFGNRDIFNILWKSMTQEMLVLMHFPALHFCFHFPKKPEKEVRAVHGN